MNTEVSDDQNNSSIQADLTEVGQTLIFLCGGNFETKIEAVFLLFEIDDTQTLTLDEFTNFIGVIFRTFLHFLNQSSVVIDYRQLTQQTADKCYADLQKNPSEEISRSEIMLWFGNKKIYSIKHEEILLKHKPPPKSKLIQKRKE